MKITFETVRSTIKAFPQGSAINELILWTEQKGFAQATVTDLSVKSFFNTAARTVTIAFAMPALKGVGMLYNFTVGSLKLGVGVIAHFRDTKDPQIKAEISAGLEHLLTVVYDLVIGIFSTLFALVYGLFPTFCLQTHQSGFIKQGADAIVKGIFPEQARSRWRIWK